jgi:hypothetical protein
MIRLLLNQCENLNSFILIFLFQMDEKRKAFRKQTTGVKADRRKQKKKEEDNEQPPSSTLDDAKRRNPKAFSIQNPIKAQQEFRR